MKAHEPQSRRIHILRWLGYRAAWGLAGFAATACDGSCAAAERPNIVIVMADDMGWSDIGCYGGEIPTPHIDALAKRGLRFTQFYNNAICGPTRVSLLTGLYPQQIGHRGDQWNEPWDYSRCVTIAEVLQRAGYRTMMAGKWQGRDLPFQRGFHRSFGPESLSMISYFHEVQGNAFYRDGQRWQPPDDFFMTDAISDHAVEFVAEAGGDKRPFFLYVAYIAPHWPLHAREGDVQPHRERYRQDGWDYWHRWRFARQREMELIPPEWRLGPRPAGIGDWANDPHKDWQAERMAVYAAQVVNIDRGVGRIVDAIRSTGREENTLVLFLSDNGAAPDGGLAPSTSGFGFGPQAPNDQWRRDGVAIRPGSGPNTMPGQPDTFAAYGPAWATVSNTPLRSTKLTAYEGGIRTPLVASWPVGIRDAGRLCHEVGHVIDILPTCLHLACADYPSEFNGRSPQPMEGQSLVPLFGGQGREGHALLAWSVPQNRAIRSDRWKLVGAAGRPWELYDLDADGTETRDLAAAEPERVRQMAAAWEAWAERCGAKAHREPRAN